MRFRSGNDDLPPPWPPFIRSKTTKRVPLAMRARLNRQAFTLANSAHGRVRCSSERFLRSVRLLQA